MRAVHAPHRQVQVPFQWQCQFHICIWADKPPEDADCPCPWALCGKQQGSDTGRSYVSGQTLKKKISVTSSNQLQRAYFQVNMAKTDQLERLQNQKTVEGCHGWLYGPHTVQRAWMKGWAVTKLQPTCTCMLSHVWLCDPMDCCSPGSSVHGFFQARILEWDAGFQLQGILLTQGLDSCLLCLLHWQADSLPLHHLGSPQIQPAFHYLGLALVQCSSSFTSHEDFPFEKKIFPFCWSFCPSFLPHSSLLKFLLSFQRFFSFSC